jgi:hypothetical protein
MNVARQLRPIALVCGKSVSILPTVGVGSAWEETGMTTETGETYEPTESPVGRGLMLVVSVMVVLGVLGIFLVSV